VIPEEFNEDRSDWEEHCEYEPEGGVPGCRMGMLVGGPQDGHRFPLEKVICDCCDGPATHYACKHEDQAAYAIYKLEEASLIMFSDVQYVFDHYETEEGDDWVQVDHEESED